MDLEEGMPRKIGLSVGVAALFTLALVVIGVRYNHDGLGSEGGLALVATIVLFVLVMAGVGVYLDGR
ncbi:MAG: hypothetical protein ABEJ61_06915 [Haloferacaceae archaeon]